MYLVDKNILSAAAPTKAAWTPALVAWMEANTARLYLSAVTIAELEDGVANARRKGATAKARQLAAWLESLVGLYADRILAFDTPVARLAGALSDRARGAGHAPDLADIFIAATARHHDLTVLTRNRKHFDHLGVDVIDPYAALPD